MDHITSEERGLLMDLESGPMTSKKGTNQRIIFGKRQDKNWLNTVASGFTGSNGSDGVEYCGNPYSHLGEPSEVAAENVQVLIGSMNSGGEESGERMALVEKNHMEEKRKKAKCKKATKPPRPPKGPSLDAGDIKLVEEMSMIAMKKRARTRRLEALMEMKEFKKKSSSSSSSSLTSGSSLFALVITMFFFVVILFQGFRARSGSSLRFQGSPEPALATKSLISVEFYNHPSANDGSGVGS